MTETDVLSTDTASGSEAPGGNDAPTSGSGGTERRRRGGVSGMVLAELRELAGTLGVDTAGMRRGDLISEIKKRQSGGTGAGAAQLPLGDDADPPPTRPRPPRRHRRPSRPASSPRTTRPAPSPPAVAPAAARP